MKDEIKEILDRLEKIDHKEYIAFEFADSATFDEMARCFEERKKMANYIANLQTIEQQYSAILSENAELENKITNLQDTLKDKEEYCYGLETQITNLQQKYENSQITLAEEWKKRLEIEENNKHLDNQIAMLKQQNNAITEMGLDYKSRNEKAIEYCKLNKEFTPRLEDVENILNGGD